MIRVGVWFGAGLALVWFVNRNFIDLPSLNQMQKGGRR